MSKIIKAETRRYPFLQPHFDEVTPTRADPIVLPSDPMPSITPVTVEIELFLPYLARLAPIS